MSAESICSRRIRIPVWVWVVITTLSVIEPVQHLWLQHAPPPGAAPTGLHIPDDAIFLHAMRMFDTGYYSPYATSKAGSDNSPAYFALPYLWLYGVMGSAGRALGMDDFTTLGMANGIGGFVYLYVAFCFLREIAPRHASFAFALFSFGGGLGGVAFVAAEVSGMRLWPGFEEYFRRFALYELLEGPYVSPVLCMPRLYYTLSLALGLGGLTAYLRAQRIKCSQHLGFALLLLCAATLLNMRVGVFVAGIAALYLMHTHQSRTALLREILVVAAPVAFSGWCVTQVMRISPVMLENHEFSGAMAMWLSPFLTASLFLLVPVTHRLWIGIPQMAPVPRTVALMLVGYLVAFFALFCAYQVYYGNVLVCRDGVVTIAISDWSLLGAFAGLVVASRLRRVPVTPHPESWIVLWLLAFLAGSISGFGHGWYLRLGPQRLMVLIGLPMSVLAAQGLESLRVSHARLARRLTALTLGCGAISIGVCACYFQGPLGWRVGNSAFAWAAPGLMTKADCATLERLPEGMTLASALASDAIALREGRRVVYGTGSFNLTGQPYGILEGTVQKFFSLAAGEEFRRRVVREWGVDYIFCSDTWRTEPEVIEQLRRTPWLKVRYASGMSVLFEVTQESGGHVRKARDDT